MMKSRHVKRLGVALVAVVWIVCLVLLATFAHGDVALEVKGKTKVLVEEVPFFVEAQPGADLYFWSVPTGVEYQEKGNSIWVTKAQDGLLTIQVKTLTVDWDAKQTKTDTGQIAVIVRAIPPPKPDPDPDPDPQPDPKPDPVPAFTDLYLIVIEETKDAANNRGAWLTYGPLVEFFKKDKHHYSIVDKDVKDSSGKTPDWLRGYLPDANPLPYVFVVTEKGFVLHQGPLPESPPALLGLLQRYSK